MTTIGEEVSPDSKKYSHYIEGYSHGDVNPKLCESGANLPAETPVHKSAETLLLDECPL